MATAPREPRRGLGRTIRRHLHACLLLGVVGTACGAQQFVCLLHPQTSLPEGGLDRPARGAADLPTPFVVGADAPRFGPDAAQIFRVGTIDYHRGAMAAVPAGDGFVLEFEKTERHVCNIRREARDKTGEYQIEASYKVVIVEQPVTLWHRVARARPTRIGSTWLLGGASPLVTRSISPGKEEGRIRELTPAELAAIAVHSGSALCDVSVVLGQLVAEAVVDGRGRVELTSNQAAERATEHMRNQDNGAALLETALQVAMVPTGDFAQKWMRPAMKQVVFKPTLRRGDGGTQVLEVKLWNRLPCRVQGALRADGSRKYLGEHACVSFDLAPDQRAIAQFAVPAKLQAQGNEVVADTTVGVHGIWSLGAKEPTIPPGFRGPAAKGG